jgi:predicted RNA methylase
MPRESQASFNLRHDLYELAVTNALPMAGFLFAVHQNGAPRPPVALREDFSGTAALARGWLALNARHRAIAVDRDKRVLHRAIEVLGSAITSMRFTTRAADVLATNDRADILAATNFPLGYFHSRTDLLTYLRHARRCTNKHGIFVADLYGGSNALDLGITSRRVLGPRPWGSDQAIGSAPGTTPKSSSRRKARATQRANAAALLYHWEQAAANPTNNLVTNHIHFELPPRSAFNATSRTRHIRNAFTYHWRLWSIPELRDAMLDAGFARVEIYDRLADGIDADGTTYVAPLRDEDELDDPYVVYIVARRDA